MDSNPPPGRPRWRLALVTVLALVLAVAAALIIGAPRPGRSSGPAAAPGHPAPPPPAAPVPAGGLRDVGDTPPMTVPPFIDWRLVHGVWLPFGEPAAANFAGPAIVDGATVRGYAHTPLGALLAAEQISTRIVATPNGGWRAAVQAGVVPDAGAAAFVRLRASTDDSPPAGGYAQAAGFQFVAYSPDLAVVQLVYRQQTDASLEVSTLTLRWLAGDWKLQLQPNGHGSPVQQQVSTLTGYVPFSQGG